MYARRKRHHSLMRTSRKRTTTPKSVEFSNLHLDFVGVSWVLGGLESTSWWAFTRKNLCESFVTDRRQSCWRSRGGILLGWRQPIEDSGANDHNNGILKQPQLYYVTCSEEVNDCIPIFNSAVNYDDESCGFDEWESELSDWWKNERFISVFGFQAFVFIYI